MESMPLSMMKHLEDDVPPVFMILDTFDKDIKVINYKQSLFHLLLIYHLFLFYVLFLLFSFPHFVVIGKRVNGVGNTFYCHIFGRG